MKIYHLLYHKKWLLFSTVLSLLLSACVAPIAPAAEGGATTEPIYIGVSGPLTGQNARYGEQWKKGFDLALDEINGAGGINGRPLEYLFEQGIVNKVTRGYVILRQQ